MIKTTYVIGHRNPDTDSIASAIGYAALKQRLGDSTVVAGLMVTDITTETTLFLVEGHTRIAHVMEYPQLEPHLYELKNVMSRKKQMVPHLLKILARV